MSWEAPATLNAVATLHGQILVTWTATANAATSWEVFRSTTDQVADAVLAGTVDPADPDYKFTDQVAEDTEYWYWVRGVGGLDVVDTAAANVSSLPPYDGALDLAKLRDALNAFAVSAVPGTQVIWRLENGVKPEKSFVELHLTGPKKEGQDWVNAGQTLSEGQREFRFTMKVLAESIEVAMQLSNALLTATDRPDLLGPLALEGAAFGEVGEFMDLSGTLDSKWEARLQSECVVYSAFKQAMTPPQIETVTLTNSIGS